jgi:mRNA interferase MazF
MSEGDILIAALQQSDGAIKKRPVLLLRRMPAYDDLLVCGISSRLHQFISGFDEMLDRAHPDFPRSGLKGESVIRLSFLDVLPKHSLLAGRVGSLSPECHRRLVVRLSEYLQNRPGIVQKTES